MSRNLRRKGAFAFLLNALLAGLLVGSCSDGLTDPPDFIEDDSSSVVVTEPVSAGPPGEAPEYEPLSDSGPFSAGAGFPGVSYVSYVPGSIPEGDSIEVRNESRNLIVGAPVVDGGVDPVPIPSSVGDTLRIILLLGGAPVADETKIVPDENPPKVVRTRPGRRQTRVPLNSSMTVVFTEPITAAATTQENIQLLDGGQPVPVTLTRSFDGLKVELTPLSLLRHGATYTIRVAKEVRDLSGDSPNEDFTSDFMTMSAAAQLVGAIVFESKRDGNSEIWMMRADGSDVSRLTHHTGEGVSTGPALSPDGRKVAFSVARSGGEWEIYVINVDGTGATNLTNHPGPDGWRPAWSPDGSQITFFSTRDDPANDEIYVMNADGTGVTRLTDNPADDSHSTWSPDGTKIAFETNREGDEDIWIMNADGSDPRPLTTHPADDEWPAWSPDGTRIAFDSWRDGNREIYLMNADGSNVVRLTNYDGFDSAPAWSRDGTKIAFSSDRGGSTDIWVMNADGTGVMRLTDHPGADFFPSWSQ